VTRGTIQSESPGEKTLLERCLDKDKEAWDSFVKRYDHLISHAILQTLRSYSFPQPTQVVPDLFHCVFLALMENDCKKLRQFKWKCSLASWLHLISVTVTVDYLRKQSRELSFVARIDPDESVDEEIPDARPLPDHIMETKNETELLGLIQKELTSKERLFVELCYIRELSPSRISKILHTTENNVYQLKNRIREKMKKIAGRML